MRRLFRDHAWIAALIVAAAMLLRVVVPAGFMTTTGADGQLTVMVCSGEGSRAMTIAIPGLVEKSQRPAPGEHEKAGTTCAFAGLAAPFLGGADPILLLAALAMVAAVALRRGQRFRPLALQHLRPPLRGPPAPSIA
ncbi:DUF2946 family protein [Sphingomonas yantingensis]|uniref:DUF2946 domain-containing protein n=1 Tax=Sphingomonas yantingensis TaxID=1241761 RepID=A0A7W9ANV3_9SPHN|nr:DUF2946 family protein [Sphingomonas yantingensis]MBB5697838.1 hypothetical protein [Sphingomonas yantingensis]